MKKLFLLLFFLSSFSVVAATECEVDQLKFCERQDPRIPKMCPEVLGQHLTKTCVVTKAQRELMEKSCAKEIKDICRSSSGEEFLSKYICLTNPDKWSTFSDGCLSAMVKDNPHHKKR